MPHRTSVLLVDDSRAQALQMISLLQETGWNITHVGSGEAALDLLGRETFELILIDYYLPRLRGDDLCRRIRARVDTRLVPIAILTDGAAKDVELRGLESGADDFIAKSADPQALVARLRGVLGRGRVAPKSKEETTSARMRVLAIDDSQTYLAYLTSKLANEAYALEVCSRATEALERLRTEDFDCILVDLVMPEIDGIDVCRAIAGLHKETGRNAMVLMLTSKDDTTSLADALAAGADDFVGKSSDIIVIKGRINALLRRKALEQEQQKRLAAELRTKQLEAQQERILREAAEARVALVSELENTALALRCSKEQLHLFTMAVRGSSDGLWSWQLENGETWFAPKFRQLLGYSEEDLPSRIENWKALFVPEDRANFLDAVRAHVDGGTALDVVCRIKTQSDGNHWFRIRGKADASGESGPTQMAGSIQDITDLKQTEEELRRTATALTRSNQDLEEFAYAASHDLRSPLRGIKTIIDWLEEDLAAMLTDEHRDRIRLLNKRITRLDRLIEDLLQYSRAGRDIGKIRELDLERAIDDMVDLLAPRPGFTIVKKDTLPTFVTAAAPLQQVLRNLLNNALRHHDRSTGRIEIRAVDCGDHFEFAVSDDGPGIPPDFQKRVFGMFETLKPRDTVEGSGMGLAIVKRSIEKMGGNIHIESDGVRGCVFRFTWPKIASDSAGSTACEPVMAQACH